MPSSGLLPVIEFILSESETPTIKFSKNVKVRCQTHHQLTNNLALTGRFKPSVFTSIDVVLLCQTRVLNNNTRICLFLLVQPLGSVNLNHADAPIPVNGFVTPSFTTRWRSNVAFVRCYQFLSIELEHKTHAHIFTQSASRLRLFRTHTYGCVNTKPAERSTQISKE